MSNITIEQLESAFIKADDAGNTEDAISKEDEKVVDDFVKVTDEEFNGQF